MARDEPHRADLQQTGLRRVKSGRLGIEDDGIERKQRIIRDQGRHGLNLLPLARTRR
jgi:hypothetical protein